MKKIFTILIFLYLFISFPLYSQGSGVMNEILTKVNIDSLLYFVKQLAGDEPVIINGQTINITSRHKNNAMNDKAADYIKNKLNSYSLQTYDQWFSSTGRNVYGVKTGTQYPDQKYMICAHYDDMPSSGLAPGADDNASGTAAVIEAARIFKDYSFPFTVIFALWDEEEQGLIGSDYYAAQAALAGEQIKGVINLDMIAWDGNNDYKVRIHTKNLGQSYDLSNKMIELNQQYGIGITTTIKDPGSPYSDHQSFWDAGYSAILLIEDDASDFNPYYHTSNDKLMYFNNTYFLRCSKLSILTLANFALNLNLNIAHTPVASISQSQDVIIPAEISTGLELGSGAAGPKLYYRFDTGSGFGNFNITDGSFISDDQYNFTIPAPPLGCLIEYYIAAQDNNSQIVVTSPAGGSGFNPPGSTPPDEFYRFYCATTELLFAENGDNLNNWTVVSPWGTTTQKYVSAPSSITDSPSGSYGNNVTNSITTTNFINLTDAFGAELTFKAQWDIESDWDYAQVLISQNGQTWTPLAGSYTEAGLGTFQPNGEPVYDGTQSTWVTESIDLSDYAGSMIKLRFQLKSDVTISGDGFYLDDVNILVYSAVPVELVNLNYRTSGSGVELSWTTITETNNSGFAVEKRTGEDNWQQIGFVSGMGTTTEPTRYSFADNNAEGISLRYRLKQIDFNGSFAYYGPVFVDRSGELKFQLGQNYPNPFNPSTTITFELSEGSNTSLIVYDILGNKVAELVNEYVEAGFHEVIFDAGSLSSGMYIYTLTSGPQSAKRKLLLVK